MWTPIGVCPDLQFGGRLWHAGLSPDGRRCFLAGFDDEAYAVWDVENSAVIWRDDGSEIDQPEQPDLEAWVGPDGYVALGEGPARGRYRIFGVRINHARTVDEANDLALRVDDREEVVRVLQRSSGRTLQALRYEYRGSDWAYASFSDDGRVIAVIEPFLVRFFWGGGRA